MDWTGLTLIPPAHRVTCCGIDGVTEFTDLWWDILNPTAWLLGLPSVGRYEEQVNREEGTRPAGRTIYVNHFARACGYVLLPQGQAKSAHCTEVSFPQVPCPRCRLERCSQGSPIR